jgi:hypothetical protein
MPHSSACLESNIGDFSTVARVMRQVNQFFNVFWSYSIFGRMAFMVQSDVDGVDFALWRDTRRIYDVTAMDWWADQ